MLRNMFMFVPLPHREFITIMHPVDVKLLILEVSSERLVPVCLEQICDTFDLKGMPR